MDESGIGSDTVAELPKANVRRWGWGYSIAWIVPVIAAVVAGYVVYDRVRDFGPKITITFNDSNGVKAGQTPIKYRGVQIGEVTAVALSRDLRHAEVKARLVRSAASIAKDGSVFWLVRPEVGFDNIAGLGTVISGAEIQVSPGAGAPQSAFAGLDRAPVAFDSRGLRIILRGSHARSLRKNTAVYYRGVEVGVVQDTQLSANAAAADIHVLIRQRYAGLVRENSVFWNMSGASLSAGLFKGVQFKMESLQTLATGGVAFATPDAKGRPVKDSKTFPLHREPRKEWLEWAPPIPIPADQ